MYRTTRTTPRTVSNDSRMESTRTHKQYGFTVQQDVKSGTCKRDVQDAARPGPTTGPRVHRSLRPSGRNVASSSMVGQSGPRWRRCGLRSSKICQQISGPSAAAAAARRHERRPAVMHAFRRRSRTPQIHTRSMAKAVRNASAHSCGRHSCRRWRHHGAARPAVWPE